MNDNRCCCCFSSLGGEFVHFHKCFKEALFQENTLCVENVLDFTFARLWAKLVANGWEQKGKFFQLQPPSNNTLFYANYDKCGKYFLQSGNSCKKLFVITCAEIDTNYGFFPGYHNKSLSSIAFIKHKWKYFLYVTSY